jgi:hypothetical protein
MEAGVGGGEGWEDTNNGHKITNFVPCRRILRRIPFARIVCST